MEKDNDNTQSFMPLVKGSEVGHYKIISKIGAGGMGEVYLAEDTELKREVAIKFLPAHLSGDKDYRARFVREARAVAALSHPNIITIYEVGEFKDRPFFAMECVKGESLKDIIKKDKLSAEEAINFAGQICEGLQEAHDNGIVHRDIKPANIIVDSKGRARLLDFGLAIVASEEKLTKTGSTLGTVGYMSPEQVEGKQVDKRSDLFSVGVVLYEMLTGRRPFTGDTDAAVVRAITDDTPEPVARYKSGVSGELQQIIDKALIKDPSMRYQHADGMLADLKRLQAESIPRKKSKTGWLVTGAVMIFALIGYFVIDSLLYHKEASKEGWTNSVAVLVFRNLSGDPEQDYFCEGMTDEIIGRLSTVKDLKVTSMQSMLRFKGTDLDLRQIGKELGVDNILEGSIQREGDDIRVRAQLIRVKDDAHIWTDKYERELTSIFAIQDEISKSIAEVLEATLVGNEPSFVSRRGTDNIEAYNAYTRGRHFWRMRSKEGLETSIKYFEKAVELDSNYAAGWSGLADAWCMLAKYDYLNWSTGFSKADTFSLKAIEIDPNLAEAQTSRGWILRLRNKYEEAEERFLKAIELNPGYPLAHAWYYAVLYSTGRYEEAIAQELIAYELDPLSPAVLEVMGAWNRDVGDMEKAEKYFRSVLELEPTFANVSHHLMMIYHDSGDSVRAMETAEELIRRAPDDWKSYYNKAYLLARMGRFPDAEKNYKMAIEVSPDLGGPYEKYGWFLAQNLRNFEKALKHFRLAIELDSLRPGAYLGYGYALRETNQTAEADEYYRKAIELDPYNEKNLRSYGIYLEFSALNIEEAIKYYEKAVRLNRRYDMGYRSLALAYEKVGKLDKALEAINSAIEIAPSNATHFNTRGRLLLYSGQFDSSAADWKRYIELRPGQPISGLQHLSYIYVLKQQYSRADSIFDIITALPDPNFRSWGRFFAAQSLAFQGKFRQAMAAYQSGFEIDLEEGVYSDALIYKFIHRIENYILHLEKPELAIAEIDKMKEVCTQLPSKCVGWESQFLAEEAYAIAKAGRYEEGLKMLETAIDKTNPDDAYKIYAYNYYLAQIHLIRRNYEASAPLMEQIVAYNPAFSNRLYLGVSYLGLNRIEEAIEVTEKAMGRYDSYRLYNLAESVPGYYYLGQAYEAAGRTDDAIKQYETFLDIWKNADEGLKSVEDAKERLAILKSQI